jgi:hypothetical protein
MGKIKFKRQYAPIKFGDGPSGKTVDGKRIAALRAAEARRTAQLLNERRETEESECGRKMRLLRWVGWCLSQLKFRDSPD